jgi:teichoic acid transport system ATP-binding protein
MEPKVRFQNVSKRYNFYKKQTDKLKDLLSLKKKTKVFTAIRNISFEVFEGESIGIVGINGSGKSTLSNLLAQIAEPTEGTVEIDGEPSLIAIAAGLNNNLTGYENIELKCLMLGLKKEEINEITPEIMEFADIGDFVHQPVKNYSSGMKSRLGFAISVHTNPDILIIDEALSVGDQTFYEKCLNKIQEFKKQGKTIFFISHSVSQIRSFSDRVMWLHFGEIQEFGDKNEVLKKYKEFIEWFNGLSDNEKKVYRKKMLEDQFSQKQDYQLDRRSRNHIKNKQKKMKAFSKISIILQSLTLLIVLLGSILYIFMGNEAVNKTLNIGSFLKTTFTKENPDKTVEAVQNEVEKEIMNKPGFSNHEFVDLFTDEGLVNKRNVLPFGTPVTIVEKMNETYKVEYLGETGYLKVNDVTVSEAQPVVLDYNIQELFSFLPETFTGSYSFYLAHLGLNDEEVKNNLSILTSETVDSFGNKVQVYNTNISYVFNQDNIADRLIIQNINIEDMFLNELITNSVIKNEEEKMYSIEITNYSLLLNLGKASMTVIPK